MNSFSHLHTPVLHSSIKEIITTRSHESQVVVDATLWLWWHASILCESMNSGIFLWFDRDSENLSRAQEYLGDKAPHIEKKFIPKSFSHLASSLEDLWIQGIDCILYDLWVSSVHLDDGGRGFSLRFDWPLDMRFDRSQGKTARDVIMTLDAPDLAKIFTQYGEEKKSWFIASEIVKRRKEEDIDTTFKLLEIIRSSSFDQKSPLRVFQALRIFVNDEFAHIENSLSQALSLLNSGWIILVITFHSLEDRLVKQFFAWYLEDTIDPITGQIQKKSSFAKYTKKPIIPSDEEVSENPRSRSAKLRVIKKL
jgi:16S rRNA (cytosine1402-N4)-methyltransferase